MTHSRHPTIIRGYAALLGLGYVFLAIRVIRLRRRTKIAIGSSGSHALERAIRVHANFSEYVPLALILATFAEMRGYPPMAIHALGLMLVSGRILHACGVSRENENIRFRVAGMALTFTSLIAPAIALLIGAL